MSTTTVTTLHALGVEDPPLADLRSESDTAAAAAPSDSTSDTPKRASSLALPVGLFANQSRPTTVASAAPIAVVAQPIFIRSEPTLTTTVESLEATTTRRSTTTAPTTPERKKTSFTKGLPPRFRKLRKSQKAKKSCPNTMSLGVMKNGGPPENVLQWIEACCPKDVVPRVLAYCGPQMTATLMATNRYWFQLIAHNDSTWRGLCEGMYKWREGQDETPTTSWKEYYRLHPCVPVDYPSIPRALMVAATAAKNGCGGSSSYSQYIRSSSSSANKRDQQVRSLEILLRPGKHFVKESLVVTAHDDVVVTMKTMKLPENRYYSPRFAYAEQEHPQSFPESAKSKSRSSTAATSLRNWMGCKSASNTAVDGSSCDPSISEANPFYDSDSSETSLLFLNGNGNAAATGGNRARSLSAGDAARIHMLATSTLMPPPKYPTRATLVLRTRRNNEPVIRVKQGSFHLTGVDLEHASQGVDIWNGNAAIQIQPPLGPDNEPLLVSPRPFATLENVAISSKSGRGVVCLDGGLVQLEDCMIYDCAATGLYVGGPGSEADIKRTDVIRNGIGSRLPPSRLPRVTSGHSGVYLEQGLARITECNISSNYLTGISAVSFEKAFLHLSNSDLVANGQGNLEVPPPGTLSYDRSEIASDNNLASVGRPCLRSNLELPARARARASF